MYVVITCWLCFTLLFHKIHSADPFESGPLSIAHFIRKKRFPNVYMYASETILYKFDISQITFKNLLYCKDQW